MDTTVVHNYFDTLISIPWEISWAIAIAISAKALEIILRIMRNEREVEE